MSSCSKEDIVVFIKKNFWPQQWIFEETLSYLKKTKKGAELLENNIEIEKSGELGYLIVALFCLKKEEYKEREVVLINDYYLRLHYSLPFLIAPYLGYALQQAIDYRKKLLKNYGFEDILRAYVSLCEIWSCIKKDLTKKQLQQIEIAQKYHSIKILYTKLQRLSYLYENFYKKGNKMAFKERVWQICKDKYPDGIAYFDEKW